MSDTGKEIAEVFGAVIGAVGPEIARAILTHGADEAPIPEHLRARVRGIIYPHGGTKLASEIEHELDVAETQRGAT